MGSGQCQLSPLAPCSSGLLRLQVDVGSWRRDSEVVAKIPWIYSLWQVEEVLKGLGFDSRRTWAKTWGSLSMEKLTLGLEIKFQAHVAMWLLFYKNAQEKVSEAARPGSYASWPGSAKGHRLFFFFCPQITSALLWQNSPCCSPSAHSHHYLSPFNARVHFVPWISFCSC